VPLGCRIPLIGYRGKRNKELFSTLSMMPMRNSAFRTPHTLGTTHLVFRLLAPLRLPGKIQEAQINVNFR
jgi:hypothetical protein